MAYIETTIRDLTENPVKLIAEEWALLSAGNEEKWNTMTVSWGGVGELWGKDSAFVFVRPQRYTFKFMEQEPFFTLSFLKGKDAKKTLSLCGKVSGNDCDKIKGVGLHGHFSDGAVFPEEASLVLVCRKRYAQFFDPDLFIDPAIAANYPAKDYHRMYVGEIVKVYKKTE